MDLCIFKESILGNDIADIEKIHNIVWDDNHELMARICSNFDYGFEFLDSKVVISDSFYGGFSVDEVGFKVVGKNSCGHFEYDSVKDLLNDWYIVAMQSNKYAILYGFDRPFDDSCLLVFNR